ncbi:MAG TPA: ABC transporter permease [Candidatus Limnocylindrales bacterium]
MQALLSLTVANIKSFVRDRQALFWTLAFPLIFIFLFGAIFSGGSNKTKIGWADADGTPASAALHQVFQAVPVVELVEGTKDELLAKFQHGDVAGLVVVDPGYGAAVAAAQAGQGAPAQVAVYTDPSQSTSAGAVIGLVSGVLAQANLGNRPPSIVPTLLNLKTQDLNAVSYLVPSILGMSLMQLGIFSAIPLVGDRQKLILKRLSATPLRRWQLIGSNIIMRLIVGIAQTIIIVGIGALVFNVKITGSLFAVAGLALLGAVTFISLGYVVASFAKTEDSANGMVSAIQFPLMFLSGTFFPIDVMPSALQGVARFLPLTYLSDAMRQVMVNGAAFAPLAVCVAVLAGWAVVCFGISARFFKWV